MADHETCEVENFEPQQFFVMKHPKVTPETRDLSGINNSQLNLTDQRSNKYLSKENSNKPNDNSYDPDKDTYKNIAKLIIETCCDLVPQTDLEEISKNIDAVCTSDKLVIDKEKKLERNAQKTAVEHNKKMTKKEIFSNLNLIYCDRCGGCFKTSFKQHVLQLCDPTGVIYCIHCGLALAPEAFDSHNRLHRMFLSPSLTLQDFVFKDIQGSLIKIPVPKYEKCNKCNVTIFPAQSFQTEHHKICCKNIFKECVQCRNMYDDDFFYNLHLKFHKYEVISDLKRNSNTKVVENVDQLITNHNLYDHNISRAIDTSSYYSNSNIFERTDSVQEQYVQVRSNHKEIYDRSFFLNWPYKNQHFDNVFMRSQSINHGRVSANKSYIYPNHNVASEDNSYLQNNVQQHPIRKSNISVNENGFPDSNFLLSKSNNEHLQYDNANSVNVSNHLPSHSLPLVPTRVNDCIKNQIFATRYNHIYYNHSNHEYYGYSNYDGNHRIPFDRTFTSEYTFLKPQIAYNNSRSLRQYRKRCNVNDHNQQDSLHKRKINKAKSNECFYTQRKYPENVEFNFKPNGDFSQGEILIAEENTIVETTLNKYGQINNNNQEKEGGQEAQYRNDSNKVIVSPSIRSHYLKKLNKRTTTEEGCQESHNKSDYKQHALSQDKIKEKCTSVSVLLTHDTSKSKIKETEQVVAPLFKNIVDVDHTNNDTVESVIHTPPLKSSKENLNGFVKFLERNENSNQITIKEPLTNKTTQLDFIELRKEIGTKESLKLQDSNVRCPTEADLQNKNSYEIPNNKQEQDNFLTLIRPHISIDSYGNITIAEKDSNDFRNDIISLESKSIFQKNTTDLKSNANQKDNNEKIKIDFHMSYKETSNIDKSISVIHCVPKIVDGDDSDKNYLYNYNKTSSKMKRPKKVNEADDFQINTVESIVNPKTSALNFVKANSKSYSQKLHLTKQTINLQCLDKVDKDVTDDTCICVLNSHNHDSTRDETRKDENIDKFESGVNAETTKPNKTRVEEIISEENLFKGLSSSLNRNKKFYKTNKKIRAQQTLKSSRTKQPKIVACITIDSDDDDFRSNKTLDVKSKRMKNTIFNFDNNSKLNIRVTKVKRSDKYRLKM